MMGPTQMRISRPQGRVFFSTARFRILVAGRRFGKTHLAVAELIRAASSKANQTCWYIAPTYRQAKRIAWLMLKFYIPVHQRAYTNEQELAIGLHNGSVISLIGVDKPDSLRGANLHFAIIDEFAEMDSYMWSGIIRPMLAATGGRCLFIGTPKGFNHMYDFYTAALTTPNWERFSFTSQDGRKWSMVNQRWERIISDEEIEAVRCDPTIPERLFRQEYFASFENMAGRVYYAYDRELYPTGNLVRTVDDGGPLCLGLDFNVNPMSGVVGSRRGTQAHVLREIIIENSNTVEFMKEVVRLYPGRDFTVYPDPAGNQRRTSANVGETDFKLIRQTVGLGRLDLWAPSAPYPIVDRINTTNGLLCNAAGVRNLLIDPSCRHLQKCLDGLTVKKGTNLPDKSLGIEHVGDGLGYWVMGMFPLIRKNRLAMLQLDL